MIVLNFPQGSQEWLDARCGIATASRFADVMATIKSGEAAGRRNYRAELVVERLTRLPTPFFVSRPMAEGTEREPLARAEYESRFGMFVQEVGLCVNESGLYGASPDGLIDDDGGLEIKCPQRATHFGYLKLKAGEPPAEYVDQVQGNLMVTGRKWWDFISYNPDFPENLQLIRRRVLRDEAYIAKLELEVLKFMSEVLKDEEFARLYQEP